MGSTSGYPISEERGAWLKAKLENLGTRIGEVRSLAQKAAGLASAGRISPEGQMVTDWNLATTAGFYWSISAANAPVPDDAGSGIWWSGVVTYHPGNSAGVRIFQEVREGRQATSTRTFRRYFNGTSWSAWESVDGIRRGTGARRAASPSKYWDFWQDTDGTQSLYVGNKSGGWRKFSGSGTSPDAAWSTTQGTAPAAIIAGRTATVTLDTVLEANEHLILTGTSIGSGFGIVTLNGVVKNPTNTVATIRFMQLGSTTTQQFSFAWQIVQYA